jgi:hypothetical protein
MVNLVRHHHWVVISPAAKALCSYSADQLTLAKPPLILLTQQTVLFTGSPLSSIDQASCDISEFLPRRECLFVKYLKEFPILHNFYLDYLTILEETNSSTLG